MIVYDDMEPRKKSRSTTRASPWIGHPKMRINFESATGPATCGRPTSLHKEALQTEVEHFIECVRTGAPPISSGISGLRVIEVLEAASRSIVEQGKPVLLKRPPGVANASGRLVDLVAREAL